jgi:hypothetical protein
MGVAAVMASIVGAFSHRKWLLASAIVLVSALSAPTTRTAADEYHILDPSVEKTEYGKCVIRYAPRLQAGVAVTMDEALLVIAVQNVCRVYTDSIVPAQIDAASCVLEQLHLGIRTNDYVEFVKNCVAHLPDEVPVSSGYVYSACMIKATEAGNIKDREDSFERTREMCFRSV